MDNFGSEFLNRIIAFLYFNHNSDIMGIKSDINLNFLELMTSLDKLEKDDFVFKFKNNYDYIYNLTDKGKLYYSKKLRGNIISTDKFMDFILQKKYNLDLFQRYLNFQKKYQNELDLVISYEEFIVYKGYQNIESEICEEAYLKYLGINNTKFLPDYLEFKQFCQNYKINPYKTEENIKTK